MYRSYSKRHNSFFDLLEVENVWRCLDVEVNLLPRTGQSGVDNRFTETVIKGTVELALKLALHPRAGLNLSLHILEQDEGVISTSVNAACLGINWV